MKLYLSSYRIPDLKSLTDLLGEAPRATKVALIPNAKDYYAGRARVIKIQESIDYFAGLGFKTEVVDLREYNNEAALHRQLNNYDLVWAIGGNTFMLRYEMKRSGFEMAIIKLLDRGIVYGGESAGALVAGNSLRGIEFADDPAFAEKVIWKGMKLTDHFVLPHVDNLDFGEAITAAKEVHKGESTMIELTDSQAFVVDGPKTRVVSSPGA